MFQRPPHSRLITPDSDPSLGININGPSLIRVPDWVPNKLGKYYLYFASHHGHHIRLASAESPTGPFTVHPAGVLPLAQTPFSNHIASPDVHIDAPRKRIVMVYHGLGYRRPCPLSYAQASAYAESGDGLHFVADSNYLGPPYLRFFRWRGIWFGLAGDGSRRWYRSASLQGPYEQGPVFPIEGEGYDSFEDSNRCRMRHLAFDHHSNQIDVYYSNVADAPERIKRTSFTLSEDWSQWRGSHPEEVLRPAGKDEGAELPPEPSRSGCSCHPDPRPVHQLRDPFVYREDGTSYLYFSFAGERGIGLALRN